MSSSVAVGASNSSFISAWRWMMPGFTSTSARFLNVTTTGTRRSGLRTHISSRGDVEPFNLSDLASHLWPLSSSYESKKQVCILIFGLQDKLDTGKHWFRFVSAISFFFVNLSASNQIIQLLKSHWVLGFFSSWSWKSFHGRTWVTQHRIEEAHSTHNSNISVFFHYFNIGKFEWLELKSRTGRNKTLAVAFLQFAGVVMEKVQQLAAAGDALPTYSTCVFHSFRKEKEKVPCDLLSLETACLDTGSEFLSLRATLTLPSSSPSLAKCCR